MYNVALLTNTKKQTAFLFLNRPWPGALPKLGLILELQEDGAGIALFMRNPLFRINQAGMEQIFGTEEFFLGRPEDISKTIPLEVTIRRKV